MKFIGLIIMGYLSGSIMFAYYLPMLLKKVDIRELSDDGNPGVHNAFKYAGMACGIFVLILELLKGAAPVYIAARCAETSNLVFALVMVAPVIGHAFPLYSRGRKGGKCIAVSFGVLLGLFPNMLPVLILAFYYLLFSLVIIITPDRVKTMASFACFILSAIALGIPRAVAAGCALITITVIIRHIIKKPEEEKVQLRLAFHNRK